MARVSFSHLMMGYITAQHLLVAFLVLLFAVQQYWMTTVQEELFFVVNGKIEKMDRTLQQVHAETRDTRERIVASQTASRDYLAKTQRQLDDAIERSMKLREL